jgi:LCP family protein required for cell wall assembly
VRLVLLLVLALLVHLVALGIYVSTHLQHVAALSSYAGRPADGSNSVWLLVGSDSRSKLTRAQRKALHTGSVAGQRTDTMLLLAIPRVGSPTLVSLPRDSYVSIPGHGKNKLNAAYAFGGAALLTRTVESVTGVHIDHVAEIGLGGIVDMTDAVGGVRQCIPRAMKDAKSGLNVKAGCQTLDGKTALAYVRARYSDPKGDLGRVERQRSYLRGLVARTLSPAVLLRPDRQWRLAEAATSSLAFDGAGLFESIRLVRAMHEVGSSSGHQTTVPIANSSLSTSVGDVVTWDTSKARALFRTLAR